MPSPLSARQLALAYGIYALIFTFLLAIVVPPIQGPDEGAHYVRIDQISLGEPLAYRLDGRNAGGHIDLGIMEAIQRFYPVALSLDRRVARDMFKPIAWGKVGVWSFPNTALYPPPYYLPMAAAIVIGKHLGLDVLRTLKLARMVNALACVAVASLAIALAGAASLWLFALLLLPSSADLMASMTQDGLMLASAALVASLTLRLRRQGAAWRGDLLLLALALVPLGMCRPPYASLAVLPLATVAPPRKLGLLATGTILCLTFAWWAYCAIDVFVSVDQSHQADACAQLLRLFKHPWRLLPLLADTLRLHFNTDYAGYFITTFQTPGLFNVAAWVSLALALLATRMAALGARARGTALIGVAVFATVAGIFAIQYLTWTPVGAPSINGVLGSYFLPLAPILVAAFAASEGTGGRWSVWPAAPVILFPIASIVVTMQSILLRYYLTQSTMP